MFVSDIQAGTVIVNGYQPTTFPYTRSCALNESVTITAVPAAGCIFDGWTGSVPTVTNPLTIVMNCSKVQTAVFSPWTNPSGEISGRVWLDDSADGILDGGEVGLSGIIVNLYSSSQVINSTVSDADGGYVFEDITPGEYRVRFMPLVDYLFSPVGVDSQVSYDGFTDPFLVTAGVLTTRSAGLYPSSPAAFSLSLEPGWNLRAFPCIIDDDTAPSTVLGGLSAEDLTILFCYHCGTEGLPSWCSYVPQGPCNLQDIAAGEGYWFLMNAAGTLPLTGTAKPPFPEKTDGYLLQEGWNLVGYEWPVAGTAADYFGTMADKVVVIYEFVDGSYQTLTLDDLLEPGMAYWVAFSTGGTFYPYVQVHDDITAFAANAMIESNHNNPNFVILDVRTPNEYGTGHIAGSINVNYYDADFADQMAALDHHTTYLVYCGSGFRSGHGIETTLDFWLVRKPPPDYTY